MRTRRPWPWRNCCATSPSPTESPPGWPPKTWRSAGRVSRPSEGVIVSALSANWDPAAFKDPAELDVERGARHHLAFGFGPHQCLGQNLARMELQIVFDTLFRRVPTLRLATPAEHLPFKSDAVVYGVHELPVTW
ncbi:cytochrome P450 [Nonomuraea ferruginea]